MKNAVFTYLPNYDIVENDAFSRYPIEQRQTEIQTFMSGRF